MQCVICSKIIGQPLEIVIIYLYIYMLKPANPFPSKSGHIVLHRRAKEYIRDIVMFIIYLDVFPKALEVLQLDSY